MPAEQHGKTPDGQQNGRMRPKMSFGLPAAAPLAAPVAPSAAEVPPAPPVAQPIPDALSQDRPAGRGKVAPSRQGRRGVTFYLNPEAWKELRILSMDTGMSSDRLMVQATNLLFEHHGRQRVAREAAE